MGNEQSSDKPKSGYHVLQVQPNSPGEIAGLQSFFDFIIGANGVFFEKEDSRFVDTLKNNLNQEVKLVVWNTKAEGARSVTMIPSSTWGGSGLAGISIRYCSFENALEYVWHILDVYPNSPASAAGLQSRTDYIVGTPDVQFTSSDDFYTMIYNNEGKSVPLYVYSTLTDKIRLAHIVPNRRWGGTGSLGCDVGFGYLHRIPLNIGTVPQNFSPQTSPFLGQQLPQHPNGFVGQQMPYPGGQFQQQQQPIPQSLLQPQQFMNQQQQVPMMPYQQQQQQQMPQQYQQQQAPQGYYQGPPSPYFGQQQQQSQQQQQQVPMSPLPNQSPLVQQTFQQMPFGSPVANFPSTPVQQQQQPVQNQPLSSPQSPSSSSLASPTPQSPFVGQSPIVAQTGSPLGSPRVQHQTQVNSVAPIVATGEVAPPQATTELQEVKL